MIPARRAGVSLVVALKRTKEGSEGAGGRKEPTSTSRASAAGELVLVTIIGASIAELLFKNSLLVVV